MMGWIYVRVDAIRLEAMANRRVVAGKNVRFLCAVAEGDGVSLSWTFGGQLLPLNGATTGKYRIIGGDTESILVINGAESTDAGFYTCIGKTPLSEHRVTAQLVVEGHLIRYFIFNIWPQKSESTNIIIHFDLCTEVLVLTMLLNSGWILAVLDFG